MLRRPRPCWRKQRLGGRVRLRAPPRLFMAGAAVVAAAAAAAEPLVVLAATGRPPPVPPPQLLQFLPHPLQPLLLLPRALLLVVPLVSCRKVPLP